MTSPRTLVTGILHIVARWRYLFVAIGLVVGLCGGLVFRAYTHPLPQLQAVADKNTAEVTGTASMIWSPYGEQALSVVGHPELNLSEGGSDARPTASIAKVMTALAILRQKPLKPGEQGPNIPVAASEVAIYESDLAQNQSVIQVAAGEQLSEYQALQAMLIPSATNIADIAAPWAFGSMNAYLSYANNYAAELGMNNTHFVDASGFSPQTVSTPQDLIKLGTAASQNPVIANIVAQKSADLPVAGTVYNFNLALGQNGINGIKTGNTDEAGGALLYSANYKGLKIIGATMDAPDLGTALHDAPQVLSSYEQNIKAVAAVKAGDIVGHYTLPWGGTVDAVVQKDITVVTWRAAAPAVRISLASIPASHDTQQPVGQVSVTLNGSTQTSAVMLTHDITKPSFWWRLFH